MDKHILQQLYETYGRVIRQNPEMTQKDLGEKLSVSAATIKRTLMRMDL